MTKYSFNPVSVIFIQYNHRNIYSVQSLKYLLNPISEIFCSIQSPKYLLNPITDRNINAIQKRKHI